MQILNYKEYKLLEKDYEDLDEQFDYERQKKNESEEESKRYQEFLLNELKKQQAKRRLILWKNI